MMRFKYWEAPEAEMTALLPGLRRCGLCGREDRCFDLARAIRPSGDSASVGCVACLRAGRFGFFHITTLGYLDGGGLTWYHDDEPAVRTRVFAVDTSGEAVATAIDRACPPPGSASLEAVEELRRTPTFPTWNEVAWPFHCSEFMVYLGPWQPANVRAAALDSRRQPLDLFVEMTDAGEQRLWSDDAEEWAFTFHVFRCTECRVLRGAVDLD